MQESEISDQERTVQHPLFYGCNALQKVPDKKE